MSDDNYLDAPLETPTATPTSSPTKSIFEEVLSSDEDDIDDDLTTGNDKISTKKSLQLQKDLLITKERNHELGKDIELLKKMIISERKIRISEREKVNKFVKIVMKMKIDFEKKLQHKEDQLKTRRNSFNKGGISVKDANIEIIKKNAQNSRRSSRTLSNLFSKKKKSSSPNAKRDSVFAEIDQYEKKIEKLNKVILEKNMINESQFESLKMKDEIIRKTSDKMYEREEKIKVLEHEMEKAKDDSEENLKLKMKYETDYNIVNKRLEELEKRVVEYEKNEELYKKEIKSKTESLEVLSKKLFELKSKLSDVNKQLGEYNVLRVISGRKTENAKLEIQKNPRNKSIYIEVKLRKKSKIINVSDVTHVYFLQDPKYENRFSIKYGDSNIETFESKMREEIVTKIRNLMK